MVREPAQKIVRSMPCPRYVSLCVVALLLFSPLQAAQVTNVIDNFTDSQAIAATNATISETISAGGALGGFRTMNLVSTNGAGNRVRVATNAPNRLAFDSTSESTGRFEVIWGGANGTAGLGGIDFGAGQSIDTAISTLNFSLRIADFTNSFTWKFTDTNAVVATYTGFFPTNTSTDPAVPFAITLDSFTNFNAVNWNAIDFISLSGGDVPELDLQILSSVQVITTVPEPKTWLLLGLAGLAVAITARSRSGRRA